MDQNQDGFIDKEDLKATYASLGRCPRQNSATAHCGVSSSLWSPAPLLSLKAGLTSHRL